jgi:hypothetical protein
VAEGMVRAAPGESGRLSSSRAVGAAGARLPDTEKVTGSNPVRPTRLIESNQRSFTDPLVLGYLAAAAVLLVAFVLAERRSAAPMFDLALFRLPTFTGGSVAVFGFSASSPGCTGDPIRNREAPPGCPGLAFR